MSCRFFLISRVFTYEILRKVTVNDNIFLFYLSTLAKCDYYIPSNDGMFSEV
jgi:hypothetical protein